MHSYCLHAQATKYLKYLIPDQFYVLYLEHVYPHVHTYMKTDVCMCFLTMHRTVEWISFGQRIYVRRF